MASGPLSAGVAHENLLPVDDAAESLLDSSPAPSHGLKLGRLPVLAACLTAATLLAVAAHYTVVPAQSSFGAAETALPMRAPPLPPGAEEELQMQAKFAMPDDFDDAGEGEGEHNLGADCSKDASGCEEREELLDPDQKKAFEDKSFRPRIGAKRNGYTPHGGRIQLWPDRIVTYHWDSTITAESRKAFEEAMKEWEGKTCLKFKEGSPGKGTLRLQSKGQGCSCNLGYSTKWEHTCNLQTPNCTRTGVAVHELGHAVGLRHEHQRPEATEFIELQWDPSGSEDWKSEYQSCEDCGDISADVPYDMASIMHYKGNGQGGKIVFKKKDIFGNCKFGQRNWLSQGDIITINRWYGCPDHFCADLSKHCENWQGKGYCTGLYKRFMKANCAHTCEECTCQDSTSTEGKCTVWAEQGFCRRGNPDVGSKEDKMYMHKNCRRSCGDCIMEDVNLCKDETIWDDPDGCSKHKDGTHEGKTWCENEWFVKQCPKSCDLCPHHKYCW